MLNYAAKYYSRPEALSLSYRDLAREVLLRVTSARPFVSFVAGFINKLALERD